MPYILADVRLQKLAEMVEAGEARYRQLRADITHAIEGDMTFTRYDDLIAADGAAPVWYEVARLLAMGTDRTDLTELAMSRVLAWTPSRSTSPATNADRDAQHAAWLDVLDTLVVG